MSDPTLKDTNRLLRRLVAAAERKELGLTADPPGRVTLYANRVKAPDGRVWYRWDPQEETPIPVEKQYVRGRLTDIVIYEKSSQEGTTTKVRACLSAGRTRYEIETTLTATSGRGVVSGLLQAGPDALQRPLTIGAEPADKDQVLFMSVFTDEGGRQYPETTPEGEEPLVSALETIRSWMKLTPSPWTDRFQRSEPHQNDSGSPGTSSAQGPPPREKAQSGESASNPTGDPSVSQARKNGRGRTQHESEDLYDQSSRSEPTKEQAADALVAKAQNHPENTLAFKCQVDGTMLDEKLKGLAEYCGRDHGYVARVLDALQLQSLGQVAVGQVQTVAQMLLDEEMLRQNEEFEPDDQMPF
jgi:hypothetical protein